MTQEQDIAQRLKKTALTLRQEWIDFVDAAYDLHRGSVDEAAEALSKVAKVGAQSIRRRMLGVQTARTLGYSKEEIIQFGQEKVLGMAQHTRRSENYTKQVSIILKMAGSQRDLVHEQMKRVMKLLKMKTVEEYWDWWLGEMMTGTDEQILSSKHSSTYMTRPADVSKKD